MIYIPISIGVAELVLDKSNDYHNVGDITVKDVDTFDWYQPTTDANRSKHKCVHDSWYLLDVSYKFYITAHQRVAIRTPWELLFIL